VRFSGPNIAAGASAVIDNDRGAKRLANLFAARLARERIAASPAEDWHDRPGLASGEVCAAAGITPGGSTPSP
jgi:hypothetical protein